MAEREVKMKRLVVSILAIIVCFSLVSCGSTEPPEAVEIDTLLDALDNQAKAELNIGKATTMFVKIDQIFSDHCVVKHLFHGNYSKVYLPKEILAELDVDQYAAIYGIVESVIATENSNYFQYAFKDGHIEDIALVDEYVADFYYCTTSGDSEHIHDGMKFIVNYANARGEALTLDKSEISEYIIGTWERRVTEELSDCIGTHTPEITFFEDGTYEIELTSYTTSFSDVSMGRYRTQDGSWTVTGNGLKTDYYSYSILYKISENVCVYDGTVFVRRESES